MATNAQQLELKIDADAMKLWAHVPPSIDPADVDQQQLAALLAEQSVEMTEKVQSSTAQLVARLKSGDVPLEPVLLAEGRPPEPGRDGYVQWHKQFAPRGSTNDADDKDENNDDAAVDYYSRTDVISVKSGDFLAILIAPQEGQPGRDIYGAEVPPPKPHRAPEQFGSGIELHDDGSIVATMSGRLNVAGQRVWISPLLTISGNVDFESGNVSFEDEVLVEGNVLDLFSVRCSGDLTVRGIVEGATIICGANMTVQGGINGKKKADIQVDGKLAARFLDNANVSAGGDVLVSSEMVNSTLLAAKKVTVRGTIKGCRVEAAEGVAAGSIGSESGIRTEIIVGKNRLAATRLAEVNRQLEPLQQQIKLDQAKVAPLAQRRQGLPESQKVRLVKLLTELKESMNHVAELSSEREELIAATRLNRQASIKVQEMILDGTIIQIGGITATLRESLRGPLTLSCSTIDGQPRIVVGSGQGGMLVLESHEP